MTDDKKNKPDAPTSNDEAIRPRSAQTDDDGWGDAAAEKPVSEGWVPPMPSPQVSPEATAPSAKPQATKPQATKPQATKPQATKPQATRNTQAGASPPPPPRPRAEPTPQPASGESLRSAVGIKQKPSRADRAKARAAAKADKRERGSGDGPRKRLLSPRATLIAVVATVALVAIAALIVLGTFNSKQYYFVCHSKQITAERGRQFPPWGRGKLSGDAWRPIVIPPNTECVDATFTDRSELEAAYADALHDQANARLLSRDAAQIDEASTQLTQALLLTRDPERKPKRDAIARLQGDVDYARAKAQAASAAETLNKAAKQFDRAAQKLPRHTRDSAAWAEHARLLSKELLRGPVALRKDAPREAPRTDASPTTLRTAPRSHGEPSDAGVPAVRPVDAQAGTALPPNADATPIPPDAGLPTGGVLL